MQHSMITTAPDLPGYRVVRNLGVVRGITVRSRSIVGNFFGGLQSLLGGNITIYTNLCEQARSETYDLMCSAVTKHFSESCHEFRGVIAHRNDGVGAKLLCMPAVQVVPDNQPD